MQKGLVSVVIPSRNEIFLNKTIMDVLNKAGGPIEVIACIDETWPEVIIEDSRVRYVHPDSPKGMRYGINNSVQIANGEFIMKTDGHCMFGEGFDKILKADMQDNWIIIPPRFSLDAENWKIEQNGKPRRDYHYLCFPDPNKGHDVGMHGVEWWSRGKERSDPKYDIDDNMTCQGSCWFMKKSWFDNFLGGLSEEGYGTFSQEFQEIGMKTWLGGGEVKVNKHTWYAHLHKGKRYGRMYHSPEGVVEGHRYSADYWMRNLWEKRIHNVDWLIEKFWPVPTWPEDRSLWVSPIK